MRTLSCPKLRQLMAVFLSLTLGLASPQASARPQPSVNPIQDIINSFSENAIPDLNDPLQKKAFEFYIKRNYRGQVYDASPWRLKLVNELSPKFDPKGKHLFGAVAVDSKRLTYPVSKELGKFVNDLIKHSGTLKSMFLKPASNLGAWTKLKHNGNPLLSEEDIDTLLEEVAPVVGKNNDPHIQMSHYRSFFRKTGMDASVRAHLNEALIHLLALNGPSVQEGLRSERGEEVLTALNGYLSARMELEGLFSETAAQLAQPVLKVPLPTKEKFQAHLNLFQAQMLAGPNEALKEIYTVRPLSITESIFRSCLASSDCSTRMYTDRALDPAFYYFTVTSPGRVSKGHVTVALGDALEGRYHPVALIDKVQDIDLDKLEVVLEAVRQSVLKQGFELAMPFPFNDTHNGISNYENIRARLKTLPAYTQQSIAFINHKTRGSLRDFAEGYSNVFKTEAVKALLPLPSSGSAFADFWVAAPKPQTHAPTGITPEQIDTELSQLQSGSEEDRLTYLELVDALFEMNIKTKLHHEQNLIEWAQDRSNSIRLRNRALRAILRTEPWKIPDLWPTLTAAEIQTALLSSAESTTLNLNQDNLRFAVLTALPYFKPSAEILKKTLDLRYSGLSEASQQAIFKAVQTERIQNILKGIANVRIDGFERKNYVSLAMGLILFEATHDADLAGDTKLAEELREDMKNRLDRAFEDMRFMKKAEVQAIAEQLGPFLNRPDTEVTMMRYVEDKLADLEPLARNQRLQKISGFFDSMTYAILGGALTSGFFQTMADKDHAVPHAFWGGMALASLSTLLRYVTKPKGPRLTSRQGLIYEKLRNFKAAAEEARARCAKDLM